MCRRMNMRVTALGWTTCPLAAACDYNERNSGFEEEIALLKEHGVQYVKKGTP